MALISIVITKVNNENLYRENEGLNGMKVLNIRKYSSLTVTNLKMPKHLLA